MPAHALAFVSLENPPGRNITLVCERPRVPGHPQDMQSDLALLHSSDKALGFSRGLPFLARAGPSPSNALTLPSAWESLTF